MYSLEEGTVAVRIARDSIESHLGRRVGMEFDEPETFLAKSGLFVTLMTFPAKDLRGCIGYSEPIKSISEALREISIASATMDPRFPKVRSDEMDRLTIDVTLLTPPALIDYKDVDDLVNQVRIGRDGLIAQRGMQSGLLLPQVPVEYGWGVEDFLSHTCMKAGFRADEWKKGRLQFKKFSGQVFAEKAPRGDIHEQPMA